MLAALGVLIVTFTLIHFIPGDPVEIPTHLAGNQQILRLADGRAHPAEGRSNRAVHQEGTQECAKLI